MTAPIGLSPNVCRSKSPQFLSTTLDYFLKAFSSTIWVKSLTLTVIDTSWELTVWFLSWRVNFMAKLVHFQCLSRSDNVIMLSHGDPFTYLHAPGYSSEQEYQHPTQKHVCIVKTRQTPAMEHQWVKLCYISKRCIKGDNYEVLNT